MTNKHTPGPIAPGPWRISGENVQSIDHGRWYTVARVYNTAFTRESNKANAQLIASAPDLLEALKYIVSLNDYVFPGMKSARQAIAKATGGV